jgi:hypothetical protein
MLLVNGCENAVTQGKVEKVEEVAEKIVNNLKETGIKLEEKVDKSKKRR